MKVAVGSENPVKIEAVQLAFQEVWPDEQWEIFGMKVNSGVSHQPMSDEESIRGARNRAGEALEKSDADYGVGLEGGLHQTGEHYFDCGWIVVLDRKNNEGIGSSIKMLTPKKMVEMTKQGIEIGDIDDLLFGRENSKQAEGHFGLMTKNRITRTEGYTHAVISALTRFIHFDLYE